AAANHAMLAELQQFAGQIGFLPWTPEVGLVEFLRNPAADAQRKVREHYADHRITIRPQDIGQIPANAGAEKRQACKAATRRVSEYIASLLPNADADQVRKNLFELFGAWHF